MLIDRLTIFTWHWNLDVYNSNEYKPLYQPCILTFLTNQIWQLVQWWVARTLQHWQRLVSTSKPMAEKKHILAWDCYEVGNYVSVNKFIVSVPGQFPTSYGREGANLQIHGGTIFWDTVSGIIWVECQVSMGARETILAKIKFEEWLWEQAAAAIHHLHSDNWVFTAKSFH